MQMNMNRREFLAAFGTVAAGAVLAGCGNSNATSTDSSSDAKSDEKKGMTLIEDGKLTVVAELGFAPWTGQGFLDGKISFFSQHLALGRTGRYSRSMSASSACCSRARCI